MVVRNLDWASVRASPLAAAAIACGLWALRYWILCGFDLQNKPYWSGWFDQGKYGQSAIAFAHADLSAAHHWYPLLHSLLAAPFTKIFPGDPFFVPDLILFGWLSYSLGKVARELGIGSWQALTILIATSLVVDRTARLWLIPWTTSLSAALIWGAIALSIDMVFAGDDAEPVTARKSVLIGLITAALPLARPTDAIVATILVLVTALALWRRRRLRIAMIAAFCGGASCALLAYAALYTAIYGLTPSRYMVESAQQGFAFGDLLWKSYVVLITARPWYPQAPSLVEGLPWLIAGLAGLLLVGLTSSSGGRQRYAIMLFGAAAVPYTLTFLAYTDLQPSGLWRFNNAHYFKWMLPFLGLGAWRWTISLVTGRHRAASVGLALLIALPACVRILPRPVNDAVPARLLTFKGRTDRDWNEAYFAKSVIVDGDGMMSNVRQFHQLPDGEGERAVAITRPFVAAATRSDPGERPPDDVGEQPTARFAEVISFGLPCWFAQLACTLPPIDK